MGQFSNDLAKFETKTLAKLDLAVRKIALELFQRIILRTPVDTGRARANWQVAIGRVPEGTLELDDKTGTATVSKASAAVSGVVAGDIVYLTNNLSYSVPLEEGHSTQAPGGMVNLTVQEFQSIVAEIGIELVRV